MIREAIKNRERKENNTNNVNKLDPKEKSLHKDDNPIIKKD